MKSHYAKYIEEREGFQIIEDQFGFATYQISHGECYIRDVFVLPEHRSQNHASKYAQKITAIAKKEDCKYLTGTVVPQANGATHSTKLLIEFGFKIIEARPDKIIFIKEIV